jgi:hypothetical protein
MSLRYRRRFLARLDLGIVAKVACCFCNNTRPKMDNKIEVLEQVPFVDVAENRNEDIGVRQMGMNISSSLEKSHTPAVRLLYFEQARRTESG